jgi:hypothetical protein
VLLLAAGVGEAEVDELDLLVLEHLQNIGRCSHAGFSSGYVIEAGGIEAGRRDFLRKYEKQKLCHKEAALTRGLFEGREEFLRSSRHPAAPSWGRRARLCDPVVQQSAVEHPTAAGCASPSVLE